MTPQERLLLQHIGNVILQGVLPQTALRTLLYGISVPVFVWVMLFLAERKSWFQIGIVFLGFGASTINFVLGATFNAFLLKVLTGNTALSLDDRAAAHNLKVHEFDILDAWIVTLVPIVNDWFIMRRAWVLFHRRRWAIYVLGILWLTTLVITLVANALLSSISAYEAAEQGNSLSSASDAAVVMSFVTNCAATTLVGWILWSHLKILRRNTAGQVRKFFNVWRVLALLVESGAVYGVIQLTISVLNYATPPNKYAATVAYNVMNNVYYTFSFVYPALTLYLIHGPLSIGGIHESVMSIDIMSQETQNSQVSV